MVKFDREKVLTPFTADKAKKGDVGWVGDSPLYLERAVGCNDQLVKLRIDPDENSNTSAPFQCEVVLDHRYFYPATYEVQQAKWVKDVGLKVGDKVKLTRGWNSGEGGYEAFYAIFHEKGKIYTVTEINAGHIRVAGEGYIALPYFALEKVEGEYRPFADEKEFEAYKDTVFAFRDPNHTRRFVVTEWEARGISLNGWFYNWKAFFEKCVVAKTRKPAGVKA